MNVGKAENGFTLLELLVVIVIIGILMGIAIPSYQSYVVRANRAEAQQLMLDISSRQQQYFMDARSYGTVAQLGVSVPATVSSNYTVTVAVDNAATPPAYVITAAPKSGSPQAGDGTQTLSNTGAKTGTWK